MDNEFCLSHLIDTRNAVKEVYEAVVSFLMEENELNECDYMVAFCE